MVQKQGRLRLLRARPVVRRHARPAATTGLRTYCATRDDVARRRVVGWVCPARRPRVFDRAA